MGTLSSDRKTVDLGFYALAGVGRTYSSGADMISRAFLTTISGLESLFDNGFN